MLTYKAPVEKTLFLLSDVLGVYRHTNLPGFADVSPELVESVLTEFGKFAEEVLLPLNRTGDIEGCKRRDDGSVVLPSGFKKAYRRFAEGGWLGLSAEPSFGGQGMWGLVEMLLDSASAPASP